MHDLGQLEKSKIELQIKSRHLWKAKVKQLIFAVIIFSIVTLVIPYFPLKGSRENLTDLIGEENSLLTIGGLFLIVLIYGTFMAYNEYKAEMSDIEAEIHYLDFK